MKAILQLHHGFVPPLAHFQKLNPEIQRGMLTEFNDAKEKWPLKIAIKGENLMELINGMDEGENKVKIIKENFIIISLDCFGKN
jgi:hypothetical protein